jgi:hypothetical protein
MPRSPFHRVLAAVATPGALIALIAFFLPWYSVSCDGFVLANATGYDAAVHGFRAPASATPTLAFGAGPGSRAIPPPPDAGSRSSDESGDGWLVLLPICAAAACAAFVAALARKESRRAIGLGAVFALGAALVPLAHAVILRGRVRDAIAQRAGADPMQRGVSSALERLVQFKLEHGWYLAVFGALCAAIAAGAWWFSVTIAKAPSEPS